MLVDWLPWNHTFGGNHNVGLTIYNGGTLYIDDGKPTPALIGETLRNLREIAPTVYFNVPNGFEEIAHAMKADAALRRNLLSRVRHVLLRRRRAWRSRCGTCCTRCRKPRSASASCMGTGLGMTESAPFAIFVTSPDVQVRLHRPADAGHGAQAGARRRQDRGALPRPERHARLLARARGRPAEAFDEEGFFRTGDAVQWIDAADPHQGLKFDGRIAEDFKLATGTFVSVGPLRAKIIAAGAPYVQDAVITGLNRDEVGALLLPAPAVRQLAGLPADAPLKDGAGKRRRCRPTSSSVLDELAAQATGSANRVARAAPDARAALDRQGRGHRQGLDQPARRAQAPRRPGPGLPRRRACPSPSSPARRRHAHEDPRTSRPGHRRRLRPRRGDGARARAPGRQGRRARRQPRAGRARSPARSAASRARATSPAPRACRRRWPQAAAAHGPARILMNIAGIGTAKRVVQKDGSAGAAGRLRPRGQRQPGRHLQRQPPVRGRVRQAAAAGRRRARRHAVHRLGRRLRRPGRPAGLQRVQGRPGRHDAADGARPGAVRHPRLHHRARACSPPR